MSIRNETDMTEVSPPGVLSSGVALATSSALSHHTQADAGRDLEGTGLPALAGVDSPRLWLKACVLWVCREVRPLLLIALGSISNHQRMSPSHLCLLATTSTIRSS